MTQDDKIRYDYHLTKFLNMLTKKHDGVIKLIVGDLVAAVERDNRLRKAVVDNYVYKVCRLSAQQHTHQRRRRVERGIVDTLKEGAVGNPVPRRYGASRDEQISRAKKADAEFINHVLTYPIYGGKSLGACNRGDLVAAKHSLTKSMASTQRHLRIIEIVLKDMPEGSRKIVSELNLPMDTLRAIAWLFEKG